MVEYKIMVYENKIDKLKEELEDKEEWKI
jgi:hypothetical protein